VDRGIWLARLRHAALAIEARDGGVSVRFPAGGALEAEVRAIAAAEAECCPFLDIAVEATADQVELRMDGPPEARPIIDAMFPVASD